MVGPRQLLAQLALAFVIAASSTSVSITDSRPFVAQNKKTNVHNKGTQNDNRLWCLVETTRVYNLHLNSAVTSTVVSAELDPQNPGRFEYIIRVLLHTHFPHTVHTVFNFDAVHSKF